MNNQKIHGCEAMKQRVEYICEQRGDAFACPDNLIYYSGQFGVYGLIIHGGGRSFAAISFCPFCGEKPV
jgi:hypothetical protein